MGDAFYNNNGALKRLEMRLGDGTSIGKKIMPLWKNQSGDTIKIPQISNMIFNLSKYSFMINNRISCSQYIDNSDLNLGKATFTSSQKSVSTPAFSQDKLAETENNFTNIPNIQYAINTKKGILFIQKANVPCLGILLDTPIIGNQGEAFTLSLTFAHNNATTWGDIFQILRNQSTRQNDGLLRLEVANSNALFLYYTQPSETKQIEIASQQTNDKIVNIVLRVARDSSNNLLIDAWYNGVRKATSENFGALRGNPMNLLCFNSIQTGTNCIANLFILSARLWNVGLSDDEIDMLFKVEARNMGRENLDPNGIDLFEYLRQ